MCTESNSENDVFITPRRCTGKMGGQRRERGTNLSEYLVKSILKQGRHMASGRLKQESFKQGDQGYSTEMRMAVVSSEDLCLSS